MAALPGIPETLTLSGALAIAVAALWVQLLKERAACAEEKKALASEKKELQDKIDDLQEKRLEDTKLLSGLTRKLEKERGNS